MHDHPPSGLLLELRAVDGQGDLVQALEKLLHQVRNGEIRSIAWLKLDDEGRCKFSFNIDPDFDLDPLQMIGQLDIFRHHLVKQVAL
jgi:hypothetical protein